MHTCLCVHSSGIGLLSWPWTFLATSLKRLFTHKSRLFLLHTSKVVSVRHLQQMGQSYLTYPSLCQVKLYCPTFYSPFACLLTFKYPSTNAQLLFFRSPATRFRWLQKAPFDKQQTWALDNLYIGDGCPEMCSGHGLCKQSSCVWVNCIFLHWTLYLYVVYFFLFNIEKKSCYLVTLKLPYNFIFWHRLLCNIYSITFMGDYFLFQLTCGLGVFDPQSPDCLNSEILS